MTIVRLRGVGHSLAGQRIFGPLDLDIQSRGVIAVHGTNGAGKSTLLSIIHKLVPPSMGNVDHVVESMRVALVFQKPMMLMTTVAANIAFPLKCKGMGKVERAAVVSRLMQSHGIDHLAKQPATKLSGGEQQRVAICRAVANDPELLLMDEPTSNLDDGGRRFVSDLIEEAGKRRSVVVVSHDFALLERVAQRRFELRDGKLLERV